MKSKKKKQEKPAGKGGKKQKITRPWGSSEKNRFHTFMRNRKLANRFLFSLQAEAETGKRVGQNGCQRERLGKGL